MSPESKPQSMLRPRSHFPTMLCLPLGVVGDWLVARGISLVGDVGSLTVRSSDWERAVIDGALETQAWVLAVTCVLVGIFMATAALVGALRWPHAPRMIRWSISMAYVCLAVYLAVVWDAVRVLANAGLLPGNNTIDVFWLRLEWVWWAVALVAGLAIVHVQWLRRSVLEEFSDPSRDPALPAFGPALGDRIVENMRNHGRDPVFRKSSYGSLMMHFSLIVMVPWLMSLRGCVEDVKMPASSGTAATVVQMEYKKKVTKKEKKQRYIVPPLAAITFNIPTFDESKVEEEVEKQSNPIYRPGSPSGRSKGAPNGKSGNQGAGSHGPGGWPGGLDGGIFQFYRLEYSGSKDWADGMGPENGDRNLLDYIRNNVNFPVAAQGKSIPIGKLSQFSMGLAPPFVFMRGTERISTSRSEEQGLRNYCLGGGMLFADCGSREWDGAFRAFIARVFPDHPLVTISKEDVLFQEPNDLGNEGPSPLWRHAGPEFRGVKVNGRWVVFYHPGDCHDAWKDGHNGAREDLVQNAFMVGHNVTHYAVTRYLAESAKYRKR